VCSSLSVAIFVICITMVARAAPSVLKNFVNGIINTTNMVSSSTPIAVNMFVLLSLFSFVIVTVIDSSGTLSMSEPLTSSGFISTRIVFGAAIATTIIDVVSASSILRL